MPFIASSIQRVVNRNASLPLLVRDVPKIAVAVEPLSGLRDGSALASGGNNSVNGQVFSFALRHR